MAKESSKTKSVSNAREVFNIMKPLFAEADDVETMYCIFLNSKNKILAIEKMFTGTITSANVYPRELVKKILSRKASAVIMVHNHPSGDTEPSVEDKHITSKMLLALYVIDTILHDHIIVGDSYYSFADDGWIAKENKKLQNLIKGD
jgi:DNA repair protein RadC